MQSSISWFIICTTSPQPQYSHIREAENCSSCSTHSGLQRGYLNNLGCLPTHLLLWYFAKTILHQFPLTERSFSPRQNQDQVELFRIVCSTHRFYLHFHYCCCASERLTLRVATLKECITSSYFSIADTCFISILPLVSRAADTFPLKSRPSFVIFRRMSLTSSPRYRLLIIFSNLEWRTGRNQKVFTSSSL